MSTSQYHRVNAYLDGAIFKGQGEFGRLKDAKLDFANALALGSVRDGGLFPIVPKLDRSVLRTTQQEITVIWMPANAIDCSLMFIQYSLYPSEPCIAQRTLGLFDTLFKIPNDHDTICRGSRKQVLRNCTQLHAVS